PYIDTYITIEEGKKLTDYVSIYGSGSYRSSSDHTAIVFRENSGFRVNVPPLTNMVLSLYLSTNAEGESHTLVISKDNSEAEPEDGFTATVSTFVEEDYATSEHYVFVLKNPNTDEIGLDYFIHTKSESETEGTFLRLLYLTTTLYSNDIDKDGNDRQEYTINERTGVTNPQITYRWDVSGNLPMGCTEEFTLQPFSSCLIKGDFSSNTTNGRFALQDKTHHYTEPMGAFLIDEVVGSASDKEWTISNDTAETVTYAFGSMDEEVYCNELIVTETFKEIHLDTYPTITDLVVGDNIKIEGYGATLRRADTQYDAIVFGKESGFRFTIPQGYIARINMRLSKHNKDDGNITIQYCTGYDTAPSTNLPTVSTFIDDDDIAPESFTFQVTNDTGTDVDYFIHTESGQAHLHYLSIETFAIIDDDSQRYMIYSTKTEDNKKIDVQQTLEIGCLDTTETTFEVQPFTDTTVKGVFTTNTSNGRFVLQDKTHNYSEPQANYLIDEVVGTGTFEWQLSNPTAEKVTYAFGSAGEKVTCDELIYTTAEHTIEVATRAFLSENTVLAGVKVYGTGVYGSYTIDDYYSNFHMLVFGSDYGFTFDVPKESHVRLGLYLSTDVEGESHKVVISDPEGNEKTATISTFVDSKDTAPTFVSLVLTNTATSAKTYKIHTDSGQLRLVYLSLEYFDVLNDLHQKYEVYSTSDKNSTLSSGTIKTDYQNKYTFDLPAFSSITIKGDFSTNTSDGAFAINDQTHNYEQSEVYVVNEKVGTGTYEWTIDNKTEEEITYAYTAVGEDITCKSLTATTTKSRVVIAPGIFIENGTKLGEVSSGRGKAYVYGDWVYSADTDHTAIVLSVDSGVHFTLATDSVLRLNLWLGSDGTNQTVIIRKDDPDTGDVIFSKDIYTVVDADDVDSQNFQTVKTNNG
ncbi:MAG: hypothetical protein LUC17_03050, partial [Oscillospiraceae bacterium]|nr:hypothetical protein [Oscillospiraceae bacterium]